MRDFTGLDAVEVGALVCDTEFVIGLFQVQNAPHRGLDRGRIYIGANFFSRGWVLFEGCEGGQSLVEFAVLVLGLSFANIGQIAGGMMWRIGLLEAALGRVLLRVETALLLCNFFLSNQWGLEISIAVWIWGVPIRIFIDRTQNLLGWSTANTHHLHLPR